MARSLYRVETQCAMKTVQSMQFLLIGEQRQHDEQGEQGDADPGRAAGDDFALGKDGGTSFRIEGRARSVQRAPS